MRVAPLPGGGLLMVGTAEDDAFARVGAWTQVLAFFAEHL
jgi:hypothetical protein